MGSFISFRCFCLLVILQISVAYSLTVPQGASASSQDLIEQVCKKTKHYKLCVLSLRSNPQSSKADANGLAAISIKIASNKGKETFSYLLEVLKRVGYQGDYRRYGSCIEEYAAAVNRHFPAALKNLGSKAYPMVIQELEDAAMNPMNCEEQFGGKSPLFVRDQAVHDLAAMAAEIVRTL